MSRIDLVEAARAALRAVASLALLSAPLLAGCASRATTWSEQTADQNRVYRVDGRGDRRIVYRDNQRDATLTLVFIHGIARSKASWMFVAPRLMNTHRVVLVDLLGHGDSDKPANCDYSIGMQADILRKLILELDLRNVVLIGSSYGGAAALECLRPLAGTAEMERYRGMVLIAPAALAFQPPGTVGELRDPLAAFALIHLADSRAIASGIHMRAFADRRRVSPTLMNDYVRDLDQRDFRRAVARAAVEMFDELAARADQPRRYAGLDLPAWLIWGSEDRLVPRDVMQRLAEQLPRASTLMIEGSGHVPQEEWPVALLEHLRAILAELATDGR